MIWRPLTIPEVVERAIEATGCPPSAMLAPRVLRRLQRSLDRPGLPTDGASMADCCAQLASGLLDAIPIEAPRVTERVLRESLERSDVAWRLDGLSTVMFLGAFARAPGPTSSLADWMQRHIELAGTAEHPGELSRRLGNLGDQMRIPQYVREGFDERGEPAVYCSGPLANLQQGSRPHVELLKGEISRGMDIAISLQPRAVPLRLLYMSERIVEGELNSPERWLDEVERWLREEADGLIITDVAQRAPGFGAGVEAMIHSSQRGPRLFLLDCRCGGHSRLEEALASRLAASVERFETPADVPELVARWTDASYEELLASRRRRVNLRIAYAADAQRTAALVDHASSSLLSRALSSSSLRVFEVRHALRSVEGWLALDPDRRASFETVLRDAPSRRARPPAGRVGIAGLERAAAARGWDAHTKDRLRKAVSDELRVAGASHRLRAMTQEDWIQAYDRYFGTR